MKKTKNTAKNNMSPDLNAQKDIPTQDPHLDYVKKDADFKKRRGAQS